jgi:hypothetical protein
VHKSQASKATLRAAVNPLLLPFRNVECDSGANQFFERRFLNRVVFVDVDGPSCISLEARIEEMSGVLQRGPVKEGQLYDLFAGFARTDAPVARDLPHVAANRQFLHQSGHKSGHTKIVATSR